MRDVARLTLHPLFRPVLGVGLLLLAMSALTARWQHHTSSQGLGESGDRDTARKPRLVVAHFMLGNTYPFTEHDWQTTFTQAEETGLDGLALNLGPEDWQLKQAQSAYSILPSFNSRFKLFLSLDMNVLPSSTKDDAYNLVEKIAPLIASPASLLWADGRPLLSTFGGHDRTFGGLGWERVLYILNDRVGKSNKVLFVPSFFMPPNDFISLPYVDGTFAWNSAWPMGNSSIAIDEDQPFLRSGKPYMAAVSPLFFTHYGTSGPFAFNKNWIYRSDDLLYPTRWNQLLSLPAAEAPAIIQVVSWNDHGESHAIAPVLGAQPGSEAWTNGMDHVAFREMTRYFAERWRGTPAHSEAETEVDYNRQVQVWMWYRPHPSGLIVEGDDVGRPGNADWAQDLINAVVVAPPGLQATLQIHNDVHRHMHHLKAGTANLLTAPFVPGQVRFEVAASNGDILLTGQGREIAAATDGYNFNMWTGSWTVRL